MNVEFPYNKDVEQAQEKILQAKSAQEIKDLLKQDDPQKPNYQEGLIRLVSQHIMNQFTPEEIAGIESPPFNKNSEYGKPPFVQDRYEEMLKLSSKMDDPDPTTITIMLYASRLHDPNRNPNGSKEYYVPSFFTPPSVALSIASSVQERIKKFPNEVENIFDNVLPKIKQDKNLDQQTSVEHQIEIARKAGYVQGVCECVAAIGEDHTLGKKLLSEMNVNRDMAKKYANPETFKTLEQGIFAQTQEQKLEQTQSFKR